MQICSQIFNQVLTLSFKKKAPNTSRSQLYHFKSRGDFNIPTNCSLLADADEGSPNSLQSTSIEWLTAIMMRFFAFQLKIQKILYKHELQNKNKWGFQKISRNNALKFRSCCPCMQILSWCSIHTVIILVLAWASVVFLAKN